MVRGNGVATVNRAHTKPQSEERENNWRGCNQVVISDNVRRLLVVPRPIERPSNLSNQQQMYARLLLPQLFGKILRRQHSRARGRDRNGDDERGTLAVAAKPNGISHREMF